MPWRGRQWAREALVIVALALLPGCMFRELRRDLEELGTFGVVRGTVSGDRSGQSAIVVVAYSGPAGGERLVDSFVLVEPGSYFFILPAGSYQFAAFEDRDENFAYDKAHDRAGLHGGGAPVSVSGGQTLEGLDIALRDDPAQQIGFAFAVPEAGRRGARQLPDLNVGVVTTLDDRRFSEDNARMGLWRPVEFLFEVGAGIYFLEPYDESKIPVLFVHGAMGTPDNWRFLIEHLDRTRFQPWVAFYPTAMPLELDGAGLDRWMQRLWAAHRFPRLIVVAHSMGGLVARGLINHMAQRPDDGPSEALRLFVSLSTPWGGDARAALGIQHAPAVVPSWYDMAPGSPFLHSLLARPLPAHVPHHLLFSYGGGSRVRDEANDGVVTLASELDPRAQRAATRLYGFDDSHTGILRDPEVAALVNALLAGAAD